MKESEYTQRFYRRWQKPPGLHFFSVHYGETDLAIYAAKDLSHEAYGLVKKYRNHIEDTIIKHPEFKTSLSPVNTSSPYSIINEMIEKATLTGIGPMAGVAGAIAEYVGKELLSSTDEIIIENGGDIFIRTLKDRTVLVYAGEDSPFKDRIKIKLRKKQDCIGVCTSSRSIGHSLSFGNTDAVVVIASSTITADCLATALGNVVKTKNDIEEALKFAESFKEIQGGLIIIDDIMAAFGEIELV
jgi:ApbE superfamily uncharacterized protein (UPF0280 family)